MHLVRVSRGSALETVVFRRYVFEELNEEEPDIAEREAKVLALLESSEVVTPRLRAVDLTGDGAGCPALVMTRLPGRLEWSPRDLEPWLARLADVLPRLHATPITGADGVQPFGPYEPSCWDPPPWMRRPRLWEQALEVFHGPRLDSDEAFIHRDYHPGNVLWRRGDVSGVVDWQSASIGPRAVDVVHCRANLAGRFGREVADRFLDLWQERTGSEFHPWAEIVMLVDIFDWYPNKQAEPILQDLEDLLEQRLAELRG